MLLRQYSGSVSTCQDSGYLNSCRADRTCFTRLIALQTCFYKAGASLMLSDSFLSDSY